MPGKLRFEKNDYPTWKVVFKKISTESPSSFPIQFTLQVIERSSSGTVTIAYSKMFPGALPSQNITNLSFSDFTICVREGLLVFSEVEKECNLIIETEASVCFSENTYLSGDVFIKNASQFVNEVELEAQGELEIHCKKLINHSSLLAKTVRIVGFSAESDTLSLDNRHGQIQAERILMLQGTGLDNQSGKLLGEQLEIQTTGQFDNRHGKVLAKKGISLSLVGNFNNTEGQVEVEEGEISISCTRGRIFNRHYACIHSKTGRVILRAPYVITDDTSLVHGKILTKVIASEKLQQEAVMSGDQLSLEADYLDLQAGLLSQQQLTLEGKKRRLTLEKPIFCAEKLSIVAQDLDVRGRLLARQADISLQGRLRYKENSFAVQQTLNLIFKEGFDVVLPLKLPGSFSLTFTGKPRNTIRILADIHVGTKKGPLADFTLKAAESLIQLGGEGAPYATVSASGYLNIQAQGFDLFHGRIVGRQGLSITSSESLALGRLAAKAVLPSGLLSEGRLELDCRQAGILIQQAVLQGRSELSLHSPQQVDNVSGALSSSGDCLIASPLFKHRLPIQILAGGLRSGIPLGNSHDAYRISGSAESAIGPPAILTVGKTLTVQGKTEILASRIHHNGFKGEAPKQVNFIPRVSWVDHYLCGHKKTSKCHWINYQNQSLGTPILAVFSSGSELQLVSPSLEIAGIVFAPGLRLEAFSQGKIGWQRLDICLPPPKVFRQSMALEQFLLPHPGYVLRESTGMWESVLASYIPPASLPLTLLCADGSLQSLASSIVFKIPPELQAEVIVQILLSEFGRGFLDVLHTTPEAIYNKLQQNAYVFLLEGQGKAGLDPGKQPIWVTHLQDPILVYRKQAILGKTCLVPELVFPLSWDNPALKDWAGGLFSFSHIIVEGQGRDASVLSITAHLQSRDKIKFSHLKSLSQAKQLYHKMVSYEAVQQRSSCFGLHQKTTIQHRQAACVELQPGNTVRAFGVEYENIESLSLTAVDMTIGEGGIVSREIGSLSEQPAIATSIEIDRESHPCLLGRKTETVVRTQQEVTSSYIQSQGSVQLAAGQAKYHSLQLACEEDIDLSAEEHLALSASKRVVHSPSKMVRQGRVKQQVRESHEEGFPVALSAVGDITCRSAGTLHSTGTQICGKSISLLAEQEMVQEPLILSQWRLSKSRGLRGLTAFRSEMREQHQSGISPTLMAEEDIQLQSRKGSIILIAPLFYAGGSLSISAAEGALVIQPATFHHDLSSRQISVALRFFGSKAVEAAFKQDCLKASKALLREFPLLNGLGEVLSSKKEAGKVGQGLKTLYHFHSTLEDIIYSKNLKDFVNKQWSLDLRLRMEHSTKVTQWVELALPWLQAQAISLAAETVEASGLQAEAQNLEVRASKQVVLTAAAQSYTEQAHQQGITVGIKKQDALYGGLDFHRENVRALEYLHSHFNIAKQFTLVSEGAVSLSGIYVKTLQVVIKAESLYLETVQDRYQQLGYGASVSTGLNGSLAFSRHTRDWASEQSGIEAEEMLLVNIRKELTLLGATLQVTGSKPLKARLSADQLLTLYEYPLVEGFATVYPPPLKPLNLRIWQQNKKGELELLSVRTIDDSLPILELCYSSKTEEYTFLYPKPGLLRASSITAKDVLDKNSSRRVGGSLDASGCFARGHWLKAVGEGEYQSDKAWQLNRATVSDDIALFTQSSSVILSRSMSQARSRDDAHCHYRGFTLIGNPKTIAKRLALPIEYKELLLYKAGRYLRNILELVDIAQPSRTSSKAPKPRSKTPPPTRL